MPGRRSEGSELGQPNFPALRELTDRVTGPPGVAASGSLEVVLGRLARRMDRQAAEERELQRAVQSVVFPAVQFPISAGGVLLDPTRTSLLGPEDGQVWDVRRISILGLSSTQTVSLWRELNNPNVGNPQNFLNIFTATSPVWGPAAGLMLKSPDGIILTGSGLTASGSITLSWEGNAIDQSWLSRYLL